MPAAYVGAATALAGIASSAMNSGGSSGGSSGGGMGGSSGGYNSGASPFAGLAGGLASSLNPPQAQTQPGAYSPPSNIGEGYNYIPTGQPSVDQQIQQLLAGTSGIASGSGAASGGAPLVPNFSNLFYATPSAAFTNAGQNESGASQQLFSTLDPAISQLIQSAAFNPQSEDALYQHLLTQTQNQANVQNTEEGLGSSPFGAGVTDQSVQNLNMQWPQFLLSQLLTGTQGLNTLAGVGTQAGNLGQAGANLQSQGLIEPSLLYAQAAAPIQALQQSAISPAQSYMTSAQQPNALSNYVAAQNQITTGNQNANAAAGIASGLQSAIPWIGQGLSGLYNSLFPSSPGTSSGNPADYPTATAPDLSSYGDDFISGSTAGGYY